MDWYLVVVESVQILSFFVITLIDCNNNFLAYHKASAPIDQITWYSCAISQFPDVISTVGKWTSSVRGKHGGVGRSVAGAKTDPQVTTISAKKFFGNPKVFSWNHFPR